MQRKTVTVLFCDVVGSTALGESVDPERLQSLLARYFERMSEVVERHGGTVEKFIGDAVMAVFGVPAVREDDALRALRAAAEMRDAFAELGIEGRIGVNTGEVVTGTEERLAAGDAVNVAARLQQAAAPGEILLAEPTWRLASKWVEAEPVEPLRLAGKAEPVPARRLVDLIPDSPPYTGRPDAPFVGRADELAALERELARAVEERSCRLCTVVGEPGIGKSRLVRELLAAAGERGRVVVGRCLSYGEGITYWPLAEIVRQVAGTDPEPEVRRLLAGDDEGGLVAARVAGAVGAAAAVMAAPEETFWAFRRLFEALAADQPLIAVVDDIHWAEPTLLDLLEYVGGFSTGAAILLLCIARPDLFETRPSWSAPRPNATVVSLQPLSQAESSELVERLLSRRIDAVIEAAEGNPLFVEQLVAMQAEDGDLGVPPTLQALLAARIDRLDPDERAVIERASVEGRSFHRGAAADLLPPEQRPALGSALVSLVRKGLIRPDRAEFAGDDGFRFGHILIRDAAYDSVPKSLRAELHARYADWLESKVGERLPEFEEILGYHLERAYGYGLELGSPDSAVAARAVRHLAAAGRRAFIRADMNAAVNLLDRAAALPAVDGRGHLLLGDLGTALAERGDLERAKQVLADAIEQAREAGDRTAEWTARVARLWVVENTETDVPAEEIEREARGAIEALQALGENRALAKAWRLLGDAHNGRCQGALWQAAMEQAVEYAARTDDVVEQCSDLWLLGGALFFGPAHVEEAGARLEALSVGFEGNPLAEAALSRGLAAVRAQQGRFGEARGLVAHAKATMVERGLRQAGSGIGFVSGSVELLAGDVKAAERELRDSLDSLRDLGLEARGGTLAIMLARVLRVQGRDDEAEDAIRSWAGSTSWDDWTFTYPAMQATILASRGELEEAERLAQDAVNRSERTDFLNWRGDVLLDLAEVLRAAGKPDEARAAVEQAVALYEQKGNLVSAGRARALLEEAGARL